MSDGKITFETEIDNSGMKAGLERLKNEIGSVTGASKNVSHEIEKTFSKMDIAKPITKAEQRIEELKKQILSVESDLDRAAESGQTDTNSKSVAAMVAEQERLYARLNSEREKLAADVGTAAQKQAEAEEKAVKKEVAVPNFLRRK